MQKGNSRIKVLMFGWEFPPHNSGGLGVACLGLTRALLHQGIEVTFVLPNKVDLDYDYMKIIFASDAPIKIRHIDTALDEYVTSKSYREKMGIKYNNMFGSTLLEEVRRYALAAREIAENEEFDIIHAHDWLSFLAGVQAKEVSAKPLVTHVHATEFDRTGGNGVNKDVYDIEKEGMNKSDAIIAVSGFTKKMITQHYGIAHSKVSVVHNGVDDFESTETIEENLAALKKNYKIILFVGRLTLQKGPDYFLKTAKKVLEYEKDVLFLITGSGDMKNKLVREAAELGISDRVIFTGFLRGEKLKRVYKAADLVVMPSVSEPFGITALESLINGSPVLISKQSGVSEVVLHALKADFWDVDEMTNKVVAVLQHSSLASTLKQNGFMEVQNINWEEAAKKTKGIYQNLLR